jgi:ferritin-like metal-binding protein YciE
MPALNSAQDLLATELKEIHSAERQLSRSLPRLMKKVMSDRLRDMLEKRTERGAQLIEEIEDVLEEMGTAKARQKNVAAEGLIEDTQQHLEEVRDDSLIDPVVLASVQKVEHYCIAAWGTAASMGRLLEQKKAVKAMERALSEGKRFDDQLTRLAEEEINPAMLEAAEEDEAEDEDEEEDEDEGEGKQDDRGGSRSSRRRSH